MTLEFRVVSRVRDSLIRIGLAGLVLTTALYGTPVVAEGVAGDSMRFPVESETASDGAFRAGPLEAYPGVRWAQNDSDTPDSDREIEERIAELDARRAGIDTSGPRTTVILGGVLAGIGAAVALTAALACGAANSGSDTTCRTDRAVGIGIGGGVAAVIGIGTMIAGNARLQSRNEELREIDREVYELRRKRMSRVRERLEVGVMLGDRKGLSLGWRF